MSPPCNLKLENSSSSMPRHRPHVMLPVNVCHHFLEGLGVVSRFPDLRMVSVYRLRFAHQMSHSGSDQLLAQLHFRGKVTLLVGAEYRSRECSDLCHVPGLLLWRIGQGQVRRMLYQALAREIACPLHFDLVKVSASYAECPSGRTARAKPVLLSTQALKFETRPLANRPNSVGFWPV